MTNTTSCAKCDSPLERSAEVCPQCGTKNIHAETATLSKKSANTALWLCLLLGALGAHRFYVGKVFTGVINLFTGGFLGLWVLIDLIIIIRSRFKDKNGDILVFKTNWSLASRIGLVLGAVLSWLLITLGTVLLLASYLTAELVTLVSEQLNALKKEDYATAYSYTTKEYQHIFSLATFKLWVTQYPQLVENKKMNFDKRGINSTAMDSGFLEGTLTANTGETMLIRYQFIKEQGEWKISSIIPNPKTSE